MQETWNNILKKLVDWAGGFAGNLLLAALILLGGWWLAKLAAKLTSARPPGERLMRWWSAL